MADEKQVISSDPPDTIWVRPGSPLVIDQSSTGLPTVMIEGGYILAKASTSVTIRRLQKELLREGGR